MKHIIIPFLIMTVLIGGVIFFDYTMNKNADEIIMYADKIEEEIPDQNWDSIEKLYSEMRNKWDECKILFYVVVNHRDMDLAELSFINLKAGIDNKNMDLVVEFCASLKFYVDELLDKEKISWENIL